jgi:hypothetical protein
MVAVGKRGGTSLRVRDRRGVLGFWRARAFFGRSQR